MKAATVVGVVESYRRGPGTQRSRECIVRFRGIDSPSEAARLVGRTVEWRRGDVVIRGKVVSIHGRGGAVRVRFRRGLPGQALGTEVRLI